MRILIDAHMVGEYETGNETYVVNLLYELAKLSNVTCAATVTPDATIPERLLQSDLELIPLKSTSDWVRLAYTLPMISKHWNADILHSTYVSPLFAPCAKIATVHDVVFKRYPEFFSPRDRLLFATLLPLTLRQVDGVITVSQHAKSEIIEFFPYLKGRVYVTLESASPELFRPFQDKRQFDNIRARYCIHSDFILAVGNLQPRKNLMRLIEAFNRVSNKHPSLQLVIVGKAQWQASEVFTLVTELGLTGQIVFTGYVPDEDLAALYNMAQLFVYPSLYEGFGLPVLEAMTCGTPVITSKTSSMPEVAGGAAVLIDPYSVDQITKTLLSILDDSELRQDLSKRGLERAQQFSWSKTAEQTIDVYHQVLSK